MRPVRHLLALGVGKRQAIPTALSGKSYWRLSKTLATQADKPWLHATLAIGQSDDRNVPGEPDRGQGLTASGMFVINPPHTLKPALQAALPQLLQVLGRGRGKGQTLESGG